MDVLLSNECVFNLEFPPGHSKYYMSYRVHHIQVTFYINPYLLYTEAHGADGSFHVLLERTVVKYQKTLQVYFILGTEPSQLPCLTTEPLCLWIVIFHDANSLTLTIVITDTSYFIYHRASSPECTPKELRLYIGISRNERVSSDYRKRRCWK